MLLTLKKLIGAYWFWPVHLSVPGILKLLVCHSRTDFQLKCPDEISKIHETIRHKFSTKSATVYSLSSLSIVFSVHNCQCQPWVGAAYLLDLTTKKGQFIISHYLELIGIIDPTIVIEYQVDETKNCWGFFFSFTAYITQMTYKGFSGQFDWSQTFCKISKVNINFKDFLVQNKI